MRARVRRLSYSDRLERQMGFLERHPEVGWVYLVADRIDERGVKLDGKVLYASNYLRTTAA